jgi:hypothetical protein
VEKKMGKTITNCGSDANAASKTTSSKQRYGQTLPCMDQNRGDAE